jgi:heme-degrading monooxygenase HmoA
MKFIFEVRLKPGHTIDEYADSWVRASRIIQRAPGARGTQLHRKIGQPEVLMAIASWESKAARDTREQFLKPDAAMRAVLDEHFEIVDFKLIGEYEEPEWIVNPPGDHATATSSP